MNAEWNRDYSKEIADCLGCEYETIKNAESASAVMGTYKQLLFRGKSEGFTPVIIIPNDMMYEVVSNEDRQDDYSPEAIIEKSKTINVTELLKKRIADASPAEEEDDIMGEYSEADPANDFISLIDYGTKRPHANIIIAKIPANNPWELAAWIPMGDLMTVLTLKNRLPFSGIGMKNTAPSRRL